MRYSIVLRPDHAMLTQLATDLPAFATNGDPGLRANRIFTFDVGYAAPRGTAQRCGYTNGSPLLANRWAAAVIAANDGDTTCRTVEE
jgi:hypothetical protein